MDNFFKAFISVLSMYIIVIVIEKGSLISMFVGENTQQSYQQLLVGIRDILKNKYSQKPQVPIVLFSIFFLAEIFPPQQKQLSSSHPMVFIFNF